MPVARSRERIERLDFAGLFAGASLGVVGHADDDGDGIAAVGGVQNGGDVGAAVAPLNVARGQDQRAGRDADGEADAAVAHVQGYEAAGLGKVGGIDDSCAQKLWTGTLRAAVEQSLQISHSGTVCRSR